MRRAETGQPAPTYRPRPGANRFHHKESGRLLGVGGHKMREHFRSRRSFVLLSGAALLSSFGSSCDAVTLDRIVSSAPRAQVMREATRPGQAAYASPRSYTVLPGDTLVSIADAEHVGVERLVSLNNLEDPSLIEAGRVLRLDDEVVDRAPPLAQRATSPSLPFGMTSEGARLGASVAAVPVVFILGYVALSWLAGGLVTAVRPMARLLAGLRPLALESTPGSEATLRFETLTAGSSTVPPSSLRTGTPQEVSGDTVGTRPTALRGASQALRRKSVQVAHRASHLVRSSLAVARGAARRAIVLALDLLGRAAGSAHRAVKRVLRAMRRRRLGLHSSGSFWVRGAALLRVGNLDGAEAHYQAGLETCVEHAWTLEAVRCLERLAHVAELRNDHSLARGLLHAALETSEAHPE